MNNAPSINVTINPDGTVTVSPSGFKGKTCRDATKFLEDALGLNDEKRKPTPEAYHHETTKQNVRA